MSLQDEKKEAARVTEAVRALKEATLPPEVLQELKLEKDWGSKVPVSFVEKVIRLADRNKDTLKELADH